MDRGAWWATVHGVAESDTIEWLYYSLVAQRVIKRLPTMWETLVWSLGWEDPLEKEMTTHSSILAWKISWTDEPGRQQSIGSQRLRHDWMTSLSLSLLHLYSRYESFAYMDLSVFCIIVVLSMICLRKVSLPQCQFCRSFWFWLLNLYLQSTRNWLLYI